MRIAPVLSPLEIAILSSVRVKPRSGYEIRKLFASSPLPLGDSPGAVYPALRRLEKAGLIESAADRESARARKTFHATPAGRRAMQSTASSPIVADDIARDPDRLLLRAGLLDEPAARDFLRSWSRAMASHAVEMRKRRGSATDWAEWLLADHAVTLYTARARWAQRAAGALKSRRPS